MLRLFKKIALLSPVYKYKIFGTSMSPTLYEDQIILINRLSYLFKAPQQEDIIALRDPRDQKVLIKRIAEINNGEYFVQGDNKKHSTDSRIFGMIKRHDIIGKVIMK